MPCQIHHGEENLGLRRLNSVIGKEKKKKGIEVASSFIHYV